MLRVSPLTPVTSLSRALLTVFCCLTFTCGVRTSPLVPCQIPLHRSQPVVLLVMEHSSTMGSPGGDTVEDFFNRPRYWLWDRATDSLRDVLPRIEQDVRIGFYFFPTEYPINTPVRIHCVVPESVDLEPALHNSDRILDRLVSLGGLTSGDSAVTSALRFARGWFQTNVPASVPKFIFLVSAGSAVCNAELTWDQCVCIYPNRPVDSCMRAQGQILNCSDEIGTTNTLRELYQLQIPTIVFGMSLVVDDPIQRERQRMLNLLGRGSLIGRSDPERQYYDLRSSAEVQEVLERTVLSAAYCQLTAGQLPLEPTLFSVRNSQGELVPRDVSHTNGWDWVDSHIGSLRIYGEACSRVVQQRESLMLTSRENAC